ncbi:unnamed protein product [Rotaria socialis]|uniref:Band 7 domain-containing protein n=1 Tax=Rotaria socialis TaxID=392032 RepID=A0A820LMX5_9BILA|nr:unnamed protein product [Rotaria socialis]CAF4364193.1 unnamed protein product [Rotaria socialis]
MMPKERFRSTVHPQSDRQNPEADLGKCGRILVVLSYVLCVLTFPFSLFVSIKVVKEYERTVIMRLGRTLTRFSVEAKGPGLLFVLPSIDSLTKVDLRTVTFDVAAQEILTRDSVTVSVDAVVYFRMFNPIISVTNVANARYATQLLAATTLRNIGTKTLQEILSDRENIAHLMQTRLDEGTDPWGLKVERVEIKDVRLPVSMQRSMAAEAEATRIIARAGVIAAEGEQKGSRSLKEAADIISQSPTALHLRYLQTLTHISAEKNSTIVFPIPRFDFQATSQSNFDTICQIYISQTIDQLLPFVSMLTERAPGVVDRFLTHASLLNRFTYSQPLSVCNRRSGALAIQLIDDFQDLPNFMQLTVKPFFLLKELISLLVYLLAAFGALKSLNTATYRLNLLVIAVEYRTCVIDLVDKMSNLQALTVLCRDDQWDVQTLLGDDEFVHWFQQHLPTSCTITRYPQCEIIGIWIRYSMTFRL